MVSSTKIDKPLHYAIMLQGTLSTPDHGDLREIISLGTQRI